MVLRPTVTVDDAEAAMEIMKVSLSQVGFDTETGKFDIDLIMTGITKNTRQLMMAIMDAVKKGPCQRKDVVALIAEKLKLPTGNVEKCIKQLLHDGTLFEPREGDIGSARRYNSGLKASPTESQLKFCPNCGFNRVDRDGLRYLKDGSSKQRWLCKKCDYRFSKGASTITANIKPNCLTSGGAINTASILILNRQVCAEAKNLTVTETKTVAGKSQERQSCKGIIIEYGFWLQKEGFAELPFQDASDSLKRCQNVEQTFSTQSQ